MFIIKLLVNLIWYGLHYILKRELNIDDSTYSNTSKANKYYLYLLSCKANM